MPNREIEIRPSPLDRRISRRAIVGAGAGILGLGITAGMYTSHEASSLEPRIQDAEAFEERGPSQMGYAERVQSELYDQHHIHIKNGVSIGGIVAGVGILAADVINLRVIQPIRQERTPTSHSETIRPYSEND